MPRAWWAAGVWEPFQGTGGSPLSEGTPALRGPTLHLFLQGAWRLARVRLAWMPWERQ